ETPHPGEKVHAAVRFSGIAYAGMRRIACVEISVDEGDWTEIAFDAGEPGGWSRWAFEWHAPAPGVYSLRVRATDESGETQTEGAPDQPFPNGSSAIHRIVFEVI
ncbi:MAG: sulfite oxidase, partial [Anaerolineae bacterium]|nr:sulfite oxidase [Anaerolineae bacterium]